MVKDLRIAGFFSVKLARSETGAVALRFSRKNGTVKVLATATLAAKERARTDEHAHTKGGEVFILLLPAGWMMSLPRLLCLAPRNHRVRCSE
jgi:hypothetical protein